MIKKIFRPFNDKKALIEEPSKNKSAETNPMPQPSRTLYPVPAEKKLAPHLLPR